VNEKSRIEYDMHGKNTLMNEKQYKNRDCHNITKVVYEEIRSRTEGSVSETS
jgi:hypothetical protein